MRNLLQELLAEFYDELPMVAETTPREVVLPEARKLIKVAVGVRRCGKSTLLWQTIHALLDSGIALEQVLYLNFEDDRLLPQSQEQLVALLDAFYTLYPENHDRMVYLFLDEIQMVPNWQLVVRRFFDTKQVQLYLSGSSAKLLSTEIATELRGRAIATEVWPFSFSEYCRFHEHELAQKPFGKQAFDKTQRYLEAYYHDSGFPAVQELDDLDRRTVLQGYVDAVVLRDIVERYKVTNVTLIKYLIKTILSNVGTSFSINKFHNDVTSQGKGVGKNTLYTYMDHIEDAYLAFMVPCYHPSFRQAQSRPKKIYVVDMGLAIASSFSLNERWGSLFENHLYLDLRRQGCKVHYYLTEEGYEVDFLVEKRDGTKELIQAVWDNTDPATQRREKRALDAAQKELGLPGRIVSLRDYLENGFG